MKRGDFSVKNWTLLMQIRDKLKMHTSNMNDFCLRIHTLCSPFTGRLLLYCRRELVQRKFFCIFRDYRAKSKAFHVFRYRFSPVPKWLKINVNKLIFFHSTHLLYFSIRREKHTPAMVFWCCVFVRTNLGNITIAASWTTWCWFIHMSSAKLGGNLWSIVTPIGCQM